MCHTQYLAHHLANYTHSGRRALTFLVENGPWAVFKGYSTSLDIVVQYTWDNRSVLSIGLIVLLVIEVLVIELSCTIYQWWMVQKVEHARRVGLLALLGLPGPVLRHLSNKPVIVLEDSDDEDDGGDDDE